MRLTKGSMMEVLVHEDAETGACTWRHAEVISGNGRTYTLAYYSPFGTSYEVADRVPRKAIRPLPPDLEESLDSWLFGDIIEVFHHYSWKTGVLVNQIDDNHFSVRLLGTSHVFKEDRSRIRIPQGWNKDSGEWLIMRHFDFACSNITQDTCPIEIDEPLSDRTSSVGSCDSKGISNYISGSKTCYTQHYCSDAESSSGREYKKEGASKAKSSHSSDVKKYRGVLEKLYATGSLSWEQELQIMDLRRTLNISSDEHLIIIRSLLAAGSSRINVN
ncbi:hypothetical protein ACFE04_031795 [Oxalis oulophora]